MTRFAALLRAVNVAGHGMLSMSELRSAIESLGFDDVKTILQSGNVVFSSKSGSASSIQKRLASMPLLAGADVFVRTSAEWREVIAKNPFTKEAKSDPARLIVFVLRDAPSATEVAALSDAIRGREYLEVRERAAYIVYPDGMGRSKLTGALVEKRLSTRGTARNWNTVMKVAAALEDAR